jgi:hypothetical protein
MNQTEQNDDSTPRTSRGVKALVSFPFIVLLLAQLAVVPFRAQVAGAPQVYAPVWSQPFYAFPVDVERMGGMTLSGPHSIDWRMLLIQLIVTGIVWIGWRASVKRSAQI